MEITALTTAFDAGNATAFVAAAAQAGVRDDEAIGRLCARLTGIRVDDPDAIADELLDWPMPAGIMHARAFDAANGREFAAVVSRNGKPVTAEEVSLLITLSEPFESGRWIETVPLPERDRGVLDLLIRFEARG